MPNVAANVVGTQAPDVERRRRLRDAAAAMGLSETWVTFFVARADNARVGTVVESLARDDAVSAAAVVRSFVKETVARDVVRGRVAELVRRRKGGGGWTLYQPNPRRKGSPRAVGQFPTKLGAKAAELSRFPPKNLQRLKRLRGEIDRLRRDPKKRRERERRDLRAAGRRREGVELLRTMVVEALFREEAPESGWDGYVARLQPKDVAADKRLQRLQKNIEQRSEAAIEDAFAAISRVLRKHGFRAKGEGLKKDRERRRTFLSFNAEVDGTPVGPVYVHVEAGRPRIELSDGARQALSRVDADASKMFRAELMAVQEDVLDHVDDVVRATADRDRYLSRMEARVDATLADMDGIELSLLRNILRRKRA